MKDPDNDLRGYLEALRNDLPSEQDDVRMRQRLHALGIAVPLAGATAATATGLATWPWWAKMGIVAAVATTPPAALMVASTMSEPTSAPLVEKAPREDTSSAEVRAATRSSHVPPPEPQPAEPQPPEPLGATVEETPPPAPLPALSDVTTPRTPARDRGRHEAPPPSTLAAETALIERALAAIEIGDTPTAELALRQHAERFPHGWLRRERQRAQDRLKRRSPSVEGIHPQPME